MRKRRGLSLAAREQRAPSVAVVQENAKASRSDMTSLFDAIAQAMSERDAFAFS